MKISFARTIRSTTHQFAQINSNQQEKDWGENLISAPVNSHPFRKGKARRARPSTRGAIWRRRETHPPSGSNRRAAWARTRRAPRRRRWGRRRRCGRRRGAPATPPPPPPTPTQDPRRRGRRGRRRPTASAATARCPGTRRPAPPPPSPGSPAAGRRAAPPPPRARPRPRKKTTTRWWRRTTADTASPPPPSPAAAAAEVAAGASATRRAARARAWTALPWALLGEAWRGRVGGFWVLGRGGRGVSVILHRREVSCACAVWCASPSSPKTKHTVARAHSTDRWGLHSRMPSAPTVPYPRRMPSDDMWGPLRWAMGVGGSVVGGRCVGISYVDCAMTKVAEKGIGAERRGDVGERKGKGATWRVIIGGWVLGPRVQIR